MQHRGDLSTQAGRANVHMISAQVERHCTSLTACVGVTDSCVKPGNCTLGAGLCGLLFKRASPPATATRPQWSSAQRRPQRRHKHKHDLPQQVHFMTADEHARGELWHHSPRSFRYTHQKSPSEYSNA